MANASKTGQTPALDDAASEAIAGLWSDVEAALDAAGKRRVERVRGLEALLHERGELREQVPELEATLERLPAELSRADLAGDSGREGAIRREFNEAQGRLEWIRGRLPEIDTRLRELGYSTTDPDSERALVEARRRLDDEYRAAASDAADTVESQADQLRDQIGERADAALLRVSEVEARRNEANRKQRLQDAREAREREVYAAQTRRTLGLVNHTNRPDAPDDPEDRPYTGYSY